MAADTGAAGGVVGIGLLGCGVVGSAVARALVGGAGRIAGELGRRPVIRGVAVRDLDKPRDVPVPPHLFTDDALGLAGRDDVDVVVELIGGANPAGAILELALRRGKHVVTANKELMARRWDCLHDVARSEERRLLAEGAVMAGVPVLGPLRTLAGGDRVERLEGVLNGTTNYCLHRMERDGLTLEAALADARRLGYTELDPSADVDGRDAASKLAILATVAFGVPTALHDVEFAGIRGITAAELAAAREDGDAIRLVAEAWRVEGSLFAHVAPRRLPSGHPLARVPDHHNALLVRARLAGELLFQGPGAGGEATASAVLADIVRAAAPSTPVAASSIPRSPERSVTHG
ncbi:MAG: homoserine dehydrogenase [Actinomycetota bacterium]|nr:homoserine dehydrogenase [Actinomycetota bacterium]